jgi:hypothetical protein
VHLVATKQRYFGKNKKMFTANTVFLFFNEINLGEISFPYRVFSGEKQTSKY